MPKFRPLTNALMFLAAFFALCSLAHAQAPQTFVSAVRGDDSNPCTAADPCKTFSKGLSEVQAGGVVTALDSGNYVAFAVTQAVTVQAAPGVYAGITTTFGSAVQINAGANDVVVIRGLSLRALGTQTTQGVAFAEGKAAHVEDCFIDGFGNGIQSTGGGDLFVSGTTVRNCGSGISASTGRATIEHCRLLKNSNGVRASASARVAVRNSAAAHNSFGFRASAGSGELNLENCLASDNGTGIRAEAVTAGTSVLVRVSGTTVTGNSTGLSATGAGTANLITRGNNTVEGNSVDGSFTGTFGAK